MTDRVFELTLRAPDGREKKMLVWLPTAQTRREFFERAVRNGLEVINLKDNKTKQNENLSEQR